MSMTQRPAHPRHPRQRPPHPGGFTLIELVAVMAIMVLVLTLALGAHRMWRRAGALQSTATLALTHLNLARQHAITQATPTTWTAVNARPRAQDGRLSLEGDFAEDEPQESGWILITVAAPRQDGASSGHAPADHPEDGDTPHPERVLLADPVRLPRRHLWSLRTDDGPALEPLTPAVRWNVTFLPDGSCAGSDMLWPLNRRELWFFEDAGPASRTNLLRRGSLQVERLTGLARPAPATEEVRP